MSLFSRHRFYKVPQDLVHFGFRLPRFNLAPVGPGCHENRILTGRQRSTVSAESDRHDDVPRSIRPRAGIGMKPARAVEPPVETVNAGTELGEMIGAASERANLQIVIRIRILCMRQILPVRRAERRPDSNPRDQLSANPYSERHEPT